MKTEMVKEPVEEASEDMPMEKGTMKSMPKNKPKKAKKGISSIDDLKAAAAKFPPKKLGGGYRG